MTVERERIRALVREELAKRFVPREGAAPASHPALVEIRIGEECRDEPDFPESRPCLIEPDRPCIQSGYCKRLGY